MAKIEVEETKVIELFQLMEKLNHFFHQPTNFESKHLVKEFADSVYPEISKAYYETTWGWLPQEVRERIESK